MKLDSYFNFKPILDITAAHIGLNRWNWEVIESEDHEKAKNIMLEKRYDVLPISKGSEIKSYYCTIGLNDFTKIVRKEVLPKDTVYYRMSISDLIKKMSKEERWFYFLSNDSEILGLVSAVNFNSQVVYNYLFQLISNLERNVSKLIADTVSEEYVINSIRKRAKKNSYFKNLIDRYNQSVKQGTENTIFEHLYISNLSVILKDLEQDNVSELSALYPYRKLFSDSLLFADIRNKVMHPVRPIVTSNECLKKLNEFLIIHETIMDMIND